MIEEEKEVVEFEKAYGTSELVLAYCLAINKLLVDKGIVTEQELTDALMNEFQGYSEYKKVD